MRNFLALFILLTLTQTSCIVVPNPHSALAPGRWRGILKLAPEIAVPGNLQFEEITEGELPFIFDVVYESDDKFYIEIINGEERFRADRIQFGRDISTAKDTLLIEFPVYDSYIRALHENDVIEGVWVINYKENYSIPFVAHFGRGYRFTELKKTPSADLSGRWEVMFGLDGDKPYPALGEFKQKDNYLEGTFLTETGDYRFLEGTVQGNKFYLSCFDGSHAFLFEGKILEDGSLIGSFRSGNHYLTTWEAKRNPDFQLRDPDEITAAKSGMETVNFTLENTAGEMISLGDPQWSGKVKLVQILGTWCPNCRDETLFLKEYLAENPGQDLAVFGVAFERYAEKEKAMAALRRYEDNLGIPYPVLLAGLKDKATAESVFPMLEGINAYPTMLFLDRDNRIRRIHTGFSGPATSEYAAFKKEFAAYVQSLIDNQ
jgi:thiol-disulfide isomerase/thioredoxin